MNKKDETKVKLLKALEECKGNYSRASLKVGVTRQTLHNYIKEDPDFKEAVAEVKEASIDYVEGKLFELIEGVTLGKVGDDGSVKVYEQPPCKTSIIFYLKTIGKNRGYVERSELTGADGKDLYSEMSEEDLKKEIEKYDAI